MKTHGHTKSGPSPTYISWRAMKARCLNPNHVRYSEYGGRGIGIFPEWIVSFASFLDHVGERPPGMTLDRINVNLGYYPGNVRWATIQVQNQNRRNRV